MDLYSLLVRFEASSFYMALLIYFAWYPLATSVMWIFTSILFYRQKEIGETDFYDSFDDNDNQPLGILFAITVLGLAVTLWWIAHNKRIAARGQRKNLMPPPPEPFEFDNLNRPIVAPDIELLKTAARITVEVDDQGHKVYTIEQGGGA